MPQDPQKIALYCQGTFSTPNPNPTQIQQMLDAADQIGASGFGTVILGQWHVHSDGSIYYNDTPMEQCAEALSLIPSRLKKSGGVKNVLITFGPFASDFQGIQNNLAAFKSKMTPILTQNNVDGFDWDLEEDLKQFHALLVQLTHWTNSLGKMVTAAPYDDDNIAFWTGVLKDTNSGGNAGFAWWNLQLYGPTTDYGNWVEGAKGIVPSPESFLVPGYNIAYTSPSSIQQQLANTQASYPNLDGGFIWRYEDIAPMYSPKQVAQAIQNGLNGVSSESTPAGVAG